MRTSERNNQFERTITKHGETEIPCLIQRYCETVSYGIIIITLMMSHVQLMTTLSINACIRP